LEADLDSANSKVKDLESLISTHTEQLDTLRERLTTAESALETQKTQIQQEKARLEREHQIRLEELERSKLDLENSRQSSTNNLTLLNSRPVSPSIPSNAIFRTGKNSAAPSTTESYFLGGQKTRRRSPSVEPSEPRSFRGAPPMRQDSFNSLNFLNTLHTPVETPDDLFDGLPPVSPHRHPDLVSVSTVAAGPSVQLVERMSATVRRLESEMAGSREELQRLKSERDDARQEIVDLMAEAEQKRTLEKRVEELEKERRDLQVKMEASLELLGEKSEKVEELEQDVQDLKGMYRELVSATVK
jgi:predicted  nucleic acid-binding Zn-ribbon protein